MNNQEITDTIMYNTDWTSLYLLKKLYFANKGWAFNETIDTFKDTAEYLLDDILEDDRTIRSSTGMLTAYRENEDEDTEVIGIRFEAKGYDTCQDRVS